MSEKGDMDISDKIEEGSQDSLFTVQDNDVDGDDVFGEFTSIKSVPDLSTSAGILKQQRYEDGMESEPGQAQPYKHRALLQVKSISANLRKIEEQVESIDSLTGNIGSSPINNKELVKALSITTIQYSKLLEMESVYGSIEDLDNLDETLEDVKTTLGIGIQGITSGLKVIKDIPSTVFTSRSVTKKNFKAPQNKTTLINGLYKVVSNGLTALMYPIVTGKALMASSSNLLKKGYESVKDVGRKFHQSGRNEERKLQSANLRETAKLNKKLLKGEMESSKEVVKDVSEHATMQSSISVTDGLKQNIGLIKSVSNRLSSNKTNNAQIPGYARFREIILIMIGAGQVPIDDSEDSDSSQQSLDSIASAFEKIPLNQDINLLEMITNLKEGIVQLETFAQTKPSETTDKLFMELFSIQLYLEDFRRILVNLQYLNESLTEHIQSSRSERRIFGKGTQRSRGGTNKRKYKSKRKTQKRKSNKKRKTKRRH